MTPEAVDPEAREAAHFLTEFAEAVPQVAVVLGSGLGRFADSLDNPRPIEYGKIPNFPVPTVSGHAGRLVFGSLDGVSVVAMQGRLHLYEGISVEAVTFGVRAFAAMGVGVLLLTTASGGINRHYRPGDIMVIEDQLNFQLCLPARSALDRAAPPTAAHRGGAVYDPRLVEVCRNVAHELGLNNVHQGVFAGMLGPTYETPAEVQMNAKLGADAVSMSTVLEALTAKKLGMAVAGVSAIVNPAAGLSEGPLNHEEVLDGAKKMEGRLLKYLGALVPALAR